MPVWKLRPNRRRCVMTWRHRWFWIVPAFLAVMALSYGAAGAADKSKVDGATNRGKQGAKQIGQGQGGTGVKGMFTGVGHTVVEGAQFTGGNIKELFSGIK